MIDMADNIDERISRLERTEHDICLAAGYILVFAGAGLLFAALIERVGSMIDGKYTPQPCCTCCTATPLDSVTIPARLDIDQGIIGRTCLDFSA